MFNQGDLDYIDTALAPGAVDHQEPEGTDFVAHLKHVIATLRTAFPDLHFDVHELICDDDTVACRSTMTGTHQGPLRIGPMAGFPVNGAPSKFRTCTSSATTRRPRSPTSGTSGTRSFSHASSAPLRPISESVRLRKEHGRAEPLAAGNGFRRVDGALMEPSGRNRWQPAANWT